MFPVSCAPFLRFGTLEPEKKRFGVWKLPNMESGSPAPAQEIETRQAIGDGSENVRGIWDWEITQGWEPKLTSHKLKQLVARGSVQTSQDCLQDFTLGGIAYGH